jgi:hypothetical protein
MGALMLQVGIRVSGFDAVAAKLQDAQRKLRVATAIALTKTAQAAQRTLTQRIERDFDRPVTFTRRAIGIEPANVRSLRAAVFVRPLQYRYLRTQIEGGRRLPKRFEQRIEGEARGARVPGAVPGAGARLNASGNIPKAALLRLLKQARTRGSGVFVAREGGHLAPGIWQRKGRRAVPLLLFASAAPQYRRRFDFYGVGERAVREAWPREFERAMGLVFS